MHMLSYKPMIRSGWWLLAALLSTGCVERARAVVATNCSFANIDCFYAPEDSNDQDDETSNSQSWLL